MLERTREFRRHRLDEILADWSDDDRAELGRLLEKFNTSMDALLERSS